MYNLKWLPHSGSHIHGNTPGHSGEGVWESNPPRTLSRPTLVLKTRRHTSYLSAPIWSRFTNSIKEPDPAQRVYHPENAKSNNIIIFYTTLQFVRKKVIPYKE